jgi:hypothetical protein
MTDYAGIPGARKGLHAKNEAADHPVLEALS